MLRDNHHFSYRSPLTGNLATWQLVDSDMVRFLLPCETYACVLWISLWASYVGTLAPLGWTTMASV